MAGWPSGNPCPHPDPLATDPLYHRDSYARSCSARVRSVDDSGVVLDRTVVYPGGGGQPPDRGWIEGTGGEVPVDGAALVGGEVVHRVDSPTFHPGEEVTVRLDWQRRYDLMRTHTALHVLCGVAWRDHGVQVTGGRMEPLGGHLDFEFETLQRDLVDEIESRINEEVRAARPVRVAFLPREEAFRIPDLIRTRVNLLPEGITEVRTVEIEGLDLQADGGTHVTNTEEVGPLRIVAYKSKGRLNKRIVIALEAREAPP